MDHTFILAMTSVFLIFLKNCINQHKFIGHSMGVFKLVSLFLYLQPADIYLIDEPSAHLDSEQRLLAAKVIKRFVLHQKKTAFIVEHDFIMATYLADKVVVFEGC